MENKIDQLEKKNESEIPTFPATEKTEDVVTEKFPLEVSSLATKHICNSRCRICASEYASEIYELFKSGVQQFKIMEILKERHNFIISKSSLSRHLTNLRDRQIELSSQLINHEMISEAAAKSVHTQNTIKLLNLAFTDIMERMAAKSLRPDIADLERLLKMKYQILTGNDEIDKDILAIFQKATDKYGVSLQQGVMFGRPE